MKRASTRRKAATSPDFSMLQDAAAFAARAHRHQLRKDGVTPYYSHVVRVAMTVMNVFGCSDRTAIAAALLHDTIEDTTTDFDDIKDRFGEEVARDVAALTKNMALPEREREDSYDAQLMTASWRAKLVKLADAYDNLHDVETFPKERRAKQRRSATLRAIRAIGIARSEPTHPLLIAAAEIVEKLCR
jgi:(p)ppGpp synthase/HD superfamily hydrolase